MKRRPCDASRLDVPASGTASHLACPITDTYTGRAVRVGGFFRQPRAPHERARESVFMEVAVSRLEEDSALRVAVRSKHGIECATETEDGLDLTVVSPDALRALASLLVSAAIAAEREGMLGAEMPPRVPHGATGTWPEATR